MREGRGRPLSKTNANLRVRKGKCSPTKNDWGRSPCHKGAVLNGAIEKKTLCFSKREKGGNFTCMAEKRV